MTRLDFLKRFGLLTAITAVLPGCATHRGGADMDDDADHEKHNRHEHDEKHEHDDDEKNEKKG